MGTAGAPCLPCVYSHFIYKEEKIIEKGKLLSSLCSSPRIEALQGRRSREPHGVSPQTLRTLCTGTCADPQRA